MQTPKIACLMLTLNRAQLTIECTEHNRRTAGIEFDLFMYDNGSTDEEIKNLSPVFYNAKHVSKGGRNRGVAHGFNVLISEAVDYDLIVLIGNDIKNKEGWLKKMWEYSQAIPDSGLIALNWGCGANPIERKIINGLECDTTGGVFGVMAIPNHVIEKVGYFCEDYHPYGLEDGDYNVRVINSGFQNFYLPGIMSEHVGADSGEKSEYRKMKDESLARNLSKFNENTAKYELYNHYYIGYGNTYEPPLNPAE
jgi:GT2 family glycosyltransferase